MSSSDGQSQYVWRWNQWSWVLVAVGILVFLLVFTANGPLWLGALLGGVVAVVGGVAFSFVPRNRPAPKLHGPGTIPGAARRAAREHKRPSKDRPRD